MSIIQGTAKSGGSTSFYAYPIGDSLRFDGSSYLSRTPSTAGNRKTWTWSGWAKTALTSDPRIFSAGTGDTKTEITFGAASGNFGFRHKTSSTVNKNTAASALLRDSSAFYHLVVSVDFNQSTSVILYVNGVQITDLSSSNYPTSSENTYINNNQQHNIGYLDSTASTYFSGYLANIQFIDGQALDASYFGETKDDIWIPKAYTGSYGTNGFHLDFADSSNIGNDVSGNNNDWTVN